MFLFWLFVLFLCIFFLLNLTILKINCIRKYPWYNVKFRKANYKLSTQYELFQNVHFCQSGEITHNFLIHNIKVNYFCLTNNPQS